MKTCFFEDCNNRKRIDAVAADIDLVLFVQKCNINETQVNKLTWTVPDGGSS